ncbi:hypothetical protein [Streptomyces sp. NBC_00258]|uniref:hypothetical protein n=1 Tax=Streptomyces sp. NBC_00258 TaxID=2903642 RepID=UPI002E2E1F0A|nr:hypothetical protein [Streptomyces sp. NBC_00258]
MDGARLAARCRRCTVQESKAAFLAALLDPEHRPPQPLRDAAALLVPLPGDEAPSSPPSAPCKALAEQKTAT